MKRYVCTVATGLLLALVSTGSAAGGLPLLADTQQGTQSTSFGDQTVEKQKNEADVNQAQGNGNLNISPALAIFGDASTKNVQGNGNTARADVDQSNSATQSQDAEQSQRLEQDGSRKGAKGHCGCSGQSQTGEQSTDFGDQTVEKQKNDADVDQYQGNGNVNISPAIAIFGDASTKNAQGNGNTAQADVDQSNSATQSQDAEQSQRLNQQGSGGQSQTGEQSTYFGDQTVEKQKNEADVNQYQGNGNFNFSPAIGIGGRHDSCNSTCSKSWEPSGGDASTFNAQGNGNSARANVGQSNEATQSQSATQTQSLGQSGGGCCKPHGPKPREHGCKPAPDGDLKGSSGAPCAKPPAEGCWTPQHGQVNTHAERTSCAPAHGGGQQQTGSQSASFGDQSVGEQKNDADVTQAQGNKNANVSPALGAGGKRGSCGCRGHRKHDRGAAAWNAQGNGNAAWADIDQGNRVDQSQSVDQNQSLTQTGKGVSRS